jgi:phosphoserine phosphatase
MQQVITVIASKKGNLVPINDILSMIERHDMTLQKSEWITRGEAYEIMVDKELPATLARMLEMCAHQSKADLVVQPAQGREKKLLIADMDSTMIRQECIDEMADVLGVKPQVAAITERAMQGEIGFQEALRARVALLKGVTLAQMAQIYKQRITFTAGAKYLVRTMRKRGAHTVLVSGGFTFFSERVAREIGFHESHANVLHVKNDILLGTVCDPILDAEAKQAILQRLCEKHLLPLHKAMAVGDGANDAEMVKAAGTGVAFHAKPILQKHAQIRLHFCDLSALLYVQGIPRYQWVQLD